MVRDANLERMLKYAAEFPPELRQITTRALQRRPEERWQTAAEFRDAIDEWLRRTTRASSRELATLLGEVIHAPTADFEEDGVVVTSPSDEHAGLSGPITRMSMAAAEAEAKRARAEFIAGPPGAEAIPAGVIVDHGSSGVITFDDELAADAEPVVAPAGPSEVGDLRDSPLLGIVFRLAKLQETGMLSLEGRAGVLKEAYFVEGQPQFVHSNVESERLGNFLVQQAALTPASLQRALSVMHRFGGRLADTLVGLDILDPLEAYRLLAKQVAAKLMEALSWQKGRYTWTPNHPNPWRARSLHLDAYRVIGAGAASLSETLIDDWLGAHAQSFVVAEHCQDGDLARFGLGDALLRV